MMVDEQARLAACREAAPDDVRRGIHRLLREDFSVAGVTEPHGMALQH